MKNKEFYKLLNKNKYKSNSGFTLTELLVGIIMAGIVVGGLGWGLMQMLAATQKETKRVNSRQEVSRTFSFIADEVKAAQSIVITDKTTTADLNSFTDDPTTTNVDESSEAYKQAHKYVPPTGGKPVLALQIPGVEPRVVYSIAPATGTWKKPNVIYRWGPNLNADGTYSTEDLNNVAKWKNEAVIDGVSDTSQSADCDVDGDGTEESINYTGFFACVVDNDDDGTIENADSNNDGYVYAVDTDIDEDGTIDVTADVASSDINGDGITDSEDLDINRDGVINLKDNADNDDRSIAAQLYFAAETEEGKVYKADSQVVARARVAPLRKPAISQIKLLESEPLEDNYGKPGCWTVRNDFGQGNDPTARPDPNNPNSNELKNVSTIIYENNRRSQPINIDTSKPFTIVASAFGGLGSDCPARGNRYQREWDSASNSYKYVDNNNPGSYLFQNAGESDEDFAIRLASNGVPANGSEEIHTYEYKVWHTIDFSDHNTFNGKDSTLNNPANVSKAASNSPAAGQNGAGDVKIFKNGDSIDSTADYQGYDENNTGDRDQQSIKEFLQAQGYADSDGNIIKLKPNQRIIAFEIGQDVAGTDSNPNPGFDLQDTILIVTSDAF